jgi:myosin-5
MLPCTLPFPLECSMHIHPADANEVLQQQFNSDVFKQQQAEYEAEGVPWTNIDFEDNSQVLLLLEAKQVGAFALLDEESRLQSGSAATFVEKLRTAQQKNPLFSVPKLALKSGGPAFTVKHYAGPVTYDTSHFLIKNTDPLHPELCEAIEESKCDFVAALFAPPPSAKEGEKKVKNQRKGSALYTQTIGSRFKEQLKDLMQLIGSTQVHYIRCVKPNAGASSELFDSELVADQLRFAGMQEAVRISRAAFPHRLPRKDFLLRFGPLRAGTDVRDEAQLPPLLAALLQPDAFCLGKTKVFMRGSTLPDLEDQRAGLCTRRVVQLQAAWRGLGARRYRAAAAAAVLRIECAARRSRARRAAATRRGAGGRIRRVWRGALARRLCVALRTSRAATRIQAAQRRHRLDRPYAARKRAAVRVQAAGRARLARSRCTKMAEEKKVQATYEYQLNEARTRLQAEADEKSALAAEKAKLETALRERAQDDGKAAERLEEELAQRRQHSEETARLLLQQQEEVLALRKQLEASEISLKAEQGAKAGAERRAEQAQLTLSMERSEHLKLQRLLDHEKAAAAAAKAREKEARHALREMGGDANAGGGGGADLRASGSEVGGGGGGASSTKASGDVQAAQAAQQAAQAAQQDAQERESQLKTKLAHAANEAARAREKLRAMQDSLRVKQREWDKDRTNLQRQAHAPPPPRPPPPRPPPPRAPPPPLRAPSPDGRSRLLASPADQPCPLSRDCRPHPAPVATPIPAPVPTPPRPARAGGQLAGGPRQAGAVAGQGQGYHHRVSKAIWTRWAGRHAGQVRHRVAGGARARDRGRGGAHERSADHRGFFTAWGKCQRK